jgi:hypothetical protein
MLDPDFFPDWVVVDVGDAVVDCAVAEEERAVDDAVDVVDVIASETGASEGRLLLASPEMVRWTDKVNASDAQPYSVIMVLEP